MADDDELDPALLGSKVDDFDWYVRAPLARL